MKFVAIRYLIRRNHGLDLLTVYEDGGRTNSIGNDYAASDEGLQTQNVSSCKTVFYEIPRPAYTRFSAKRLRKSPC
jgi:hypothetical protein